MWPFHGIFIFLRTQDITKHFFALNRVNLCIYMKRSYPTKILRKIKLLHFEETPEIWGLLGRGLSLVKQVKLFLNNERHSVWQDHDVELCTWPQEKQIHELYLPAYSHIYSPFWKFLVARTALPLFATFITSNPSTPSSSVFKISSNTFLFSFSRTFGDFLWDLRRSKT